MYHSNSKLPDKAALDPSVILWLGGTPDVDHIVDSNFLMF